MVLHEEQKYIEKIWFMFVELWAKQERGSAQRVWLDIISGEDFPNQHPNHIFILPEEKGCVHACRRGQDDTSMCMKNQKS